MSQEEHPWDLILHRGFRGKSPLPEGWPRGGYLEAVLNRVRAAMTPEEYDEWLPGVLQSIRDKEAATNSARQGSLAVHARKEQKQGRANDTRGRNAPIAVPSMEDDIDAYVQQPLTPFYGGGLLGDIQAATQQAASQQSGKYDTGSQKHSSGGVLDQAWQWLNTPRTRDIAATLPYAKAGGCFSGEICGLDRKVTGTPLEDVETMVDAAELLVGTGTAAGVGEFARAGHELKVGKNWRIAPFGNRTNKPTGQIPHYHRRGPAGPNGQTVEGQGIQRHRPWDKSPKDTSWKDRF